MRTISANAQTELNKNTGTELMVVLEIEWVDGGSIFYSDQDISGCKTKIIEMGGFDSSMQLEGASDSQQISVVMDNTDGAIRAIYQANDVHKRPARVYLLHKGLSLDDDKILVFKGELVTPIQWNETQRTATFTLLSKLESKQVGFSMEEGDFPDIPDEALGKAWPLVFGQVCHLPAVKVRAPRRGYFMEGVGIKDFTLAPRLCQAKKIECPSQSQGQQSYYTQAANNQWNVVNQTQFGVDPECSRRAFGEICKLLDLIEQQEAYEKDVIEIWNGESFPQGEVITLKVEGAEFTGVFTGNYFNVANTKHPDFDDFDHVQCRNVPSFGYRQPSAENVEFVCGNKMCYFRDTATGSPWTVSFADKVAYWQAQADNGPWFLGNTNNNVAINLTCDELLTDSGTGGMQGGPKDSWEYYNEMEAADFFWAPAGSEVFLESEAEILYIASLIGGTVDKVSAYRTAPNGIKYLTEVPTDYYTVRETDYGGYDSVVEIVLNKALSKYGENWEDQIYVSMTSDVGPNACDIIEWLVNKYTDLTVDSSTFATVKAAIANYPNNFYLLNRLDVYQLIQDIAYQSRCAVYVRNDVVYIKYLSTEPTSERTITESDILSESFVEYLSETEDVYTTHNITWKKAGAPVQDTEDAERKLVLKYNVAKYGTVENDWDYYTYNIYDLVLKSGTFWLIRKANSWKKLNFKLPIKHIDLDVGDCITINVAQFSSDPVKVVIEDMKVNPDDYTIDVACWTPIRAGESEPYYWAWPSQQSQYQLWPLPGDTNGGGGYNFEVTPPIGHILSGGGGSNDQLIISSGDQHPSDLDDSLPTVLCEVSDFWDFDEIDPVIEAKQIAQSAEKQALQNTIADNSGAQSSNNKEKQDDGECGTGAGCNYKAEVVWHTSEAQGENGGGPCKCRPNGGSPTCYGRTWVVCHTFGAAFAAQSFASYMRASYGKDVTDHWGCLETAVLDVNLSAGEHTESGCPDIYQAEPDGTGTRPSSETKAPTGTTGNELI
jgi:hypothetical protein